MLSEELEKLLDRKAYELKDFALANGQALGVSGALKRLRCWLANFDSCGVPSEVAAELVRGITFFADQTIVDQSMRLLDRVSDPRTSVLYYCAFGEENESSARIMRILNSNPRCRSHLVDALALIHEEGAASPTLVFIDDFINSGGQFERVVGDWFDGKHLSGDQAELLRRCKLLFLFAMGMEHGRHRAETVLQSHGLDGQIRVLNQYPCYYGCFGSDDDIQLMRQRSTERLQSGQFTGWEADQIAPLFEVCEEAGQQLLAKNRPHWDDRRTREHALGYGTNGQLFLNQNNVPTCTLTCLWLGGGVHVDGQNVDWEPLVPRRSKRDVGSEAESKGTPSTSVGERLQNVRLDADSGADVPLEVILIGQATGDSGAFNSFPKPDFRLSRYYDAVLPDELLGDILRDVNARRLPARLLNKSNNHLHWLHTASDTPKSVRLASVDVFTIDQSRLLYGARFKIDARDVSLHDALALIHHVQIAEKATEHRLDFAHSQSANGCRKRVSCTAGDLVRAALTDVAPGLKLASVQPRPLVFIRMFDSLFDNPDLKDQLFSSAARLGNPSNLRSSPPMPPGFRFDFDARAAVTNHGTLLFCGAGPSVNRSHLQEELATVYYFQELIGAVSGWRFHGGKEPSDLPLARINRALSLELPVENPHSRQHRLLLSQVWSLKE